MRSTLVFLCCLALAVAGALAQSAGGRTLDIYYIDTEGGQSTLFVSPTGESLLVDTGNPGDRDITRIVEALAAANVKQIDHLWTTHYHVDHVGGMEQLAGRVKIQHFYDHGKSVEPREQVAGFSAMYEALSQGKRTIVKPGDKLRMAGLDITVVASAGQVLTTNLPGGGGANPACAGVKPKDESPTDDNGQSAGFVLTYGKFRTIDLGDLLWNRELELMCPTNRIGTVDLYLTSHHGLSQSGSPALVHALAPRVAIMNNGTRKGGALDAFQTVHASPGLEDLWQLHWSYNVGLEHNTAGVFIANVEANETVAGILTAQPPAPGAGRSGRERGRARACVLAQGVGEAGRDVHGDEPAEWVQQDVSALNLRSVWPMFRRSKRHDGTVFHRPSKRPRVSRNPMEDPLTGSGLLRDGRPGPRARDRREFEAVDVREIRRRFGQTRGQFATMMGISRETLRNWERGRRYPVGPARALLRIAAADPDVVAAVLVINRVSWGRVDPHDAT